MINLYYIKYFLSAAQSGSVAKAASLNNVSSSAVSQAIKWLEEHYQIDLIEHGKNKFILTQKGILFAKESEEFIASTDELNLKLSKISNSEFDIFKLSMQQSIANTIISKAIKNFSLNSPNVELKINIGTTQRCKELLLTGAVPYSISLDNVNFNSPFKTLYSGNFVFISSKEDNRSVKEAGFILTENTSEVIELRKNYFKKFKKNIPVNYSISSWGVIANLAICGNGIAYIPDYYLSGIDKSKYKIRKIDVETAKYNINFYYSKNVEFNQIHKNFVEEVKKQFKENN